MHSVHYIKSCCVSPSKLQCLHFSSWDTNKEWMVDLPKGEDVLALCLGQGWVAAATSTMLVRLFSIGGVQREVFSLPGPVVCMAGHGEQLLIVYHRGMRIVYGGEITILCASHHTSFVCV